jgi:hypothetical protein
MTYYPDLSTSCMVGNGADVRAVGWLGEGHPYPIGPVPPAFLEALERHLRRPWQPIGMCGMHECELDGCAARVALAEHLERDRRRGKSSPIPAAAAEALQARNLWIPTTDCVYIAPAMVLHYVRDHSYRPPDEFIDAALTCPDQQSPAYHGLMAPFVSPYPDQALLYDRNWEAIRAREHARARAWTRRGMCSSCKGWRYLCDDDPAECCGGALVHLQDRDGNLIQP